MREKIAARKLFRRCFLLGALLVAGLFPARMAAAAETALNTPLDKENPVYFYGDSIQYGGKTIALGDHDIYIDGTLPDAVADQYKYVYNDFKEAYEKGGIVDGSSEKPMNVYIAPYVYWIDDPDDPAIREGINGDPVPYGLWMDVSYLSLKGLTADPRNVVLAVNRGQNDGAKGNYTMFYINGTGTHTENLTMGNYCCVDLEYPLDPSLSREKRTSTITQSQLCLTNGAKITADNCRFVSRLNSCPFVGGSRILFTDCHFECTDDSLPTGAVYLDCDFDFYSSKPFYNTTGTGSVLLNCTFNIRHTSDQYLTKAGGVVAIIDGAFNSTTKDQYIGWTPNPAESLRCYGSNVTVNYTYADGEETKTDTVKNYQIDAKAPYDNVDITGKEALCAYRVEAGGQVIYNVYNLLRGADDWDPLGQKDAIQAASPDGKDYTSLPTRLSCSPANTMITDGETASISTSFTGFTRAADAREKITWSMEDSLKDYITLTDQGDGTCKAFCKNQTLAPVSGMIYATSASGLAAGCYVTASPQTQPAPSFTSRPTMSLDAGAFTLTYALSNQELLKDTSSISWYRCSDAKGKNSILTATTTNNSPKKTYTLTYDDIGYYIMAVIRPAQQITYMGDEVSLVSSEPVKLSDVTADSYHFTTDFSDFATSRQGRVIPGFWVRDVYEAWREDVTLRPSAQNGWKYGLGAVGYGSEGLYGLLPIQRGARLMYVPLPGEYGDMALTLVMNPEKNAGQGFGSAGQYMDIFIKFDPATLTGYALRLERVTSSGRGVQAALVAYKNDTVEYISEKVMTSAFNAECTVNLSAKDGKLSATVTTTHSQSSEQQAEGLNHSVQLEADITENNYGGMGVLFTGTVPEGNRVMFNHLDVTWEKSEVRVDYDAITPQDLKTESGESETPSADPVGTTFKAGNFKYRITVKADDGTGKAEIAGPAKKSLKSAVVGKTVKHDGAVYTITGIGKKAFSGCKKLTKVKIGANVRSIGASAFAGCGKLKKIIISSKKIKKVGKSALKNIHKKCVIRVPSSQVKAYKKLFKNKGQKKTVRIVSYK